TQRRRARATATLVRRGQERLDDGPFGIGCIAFIAQPVASILRASYFGPHLVPPSCLATTTESQAAEITQPIFGSASQKKALAPGERSGKWQAECPASSISTRKLRS